jgi:arylsulfatase
MTGQYSIRNGLSLIAIEGSPYTLPANAFTMGELFKSVGYATAIFGKWHLGSAPSDHPLARQGQTKHYIVCDVLDHGLSTNFRTHHRRHSADRSGD